MHDPVIVFPWFTNPWRVGDGFAIALAVFHAIFLRLIPLTSVGWKKVDYYWVSLGLVGLLASVDANQAFFAKNYSEMESQRAGAALQSVVSEAKFGPQLSCRQLVRGEYSPPAQEMARAQEMLDAQCAWYRRLDVALAARAANAMVRLDLVQLAGPLPQSNDPQEFSGLRTAAKVYNESLDDLQRLEEMRQPGSLRIGVQFIGPLLLMLAIALRLTKVSGEIRLERIKASARSSSQPER